MIICLCHRISEHDIERAARDGVPDFEALQDETAIARNCGCCLDAARDIFEDARSASACGASGVCAARVLPGKAAAPQAVLA